MNAFSRRTLTGLYAVIILFCASYLALQAVRHSPWHQERLFRQLLAGTADQQLTSASALAQLGAEDRLLAGLKAEDPHAREMAQRGLEYLWFHAAGSTAYERLKAAYEAAQQHQYPQALTLLDQLIQRHPDFAEAWNRRAAVLWEMGEYERSRADCQRALDLNPNHYGAWQGIGLCQLQDGDLLGACASLRAALRILPHDEITRESLRRCEEVLQTRPRQEPAQPGEVLI